MLMGAASDLFPHLLKTPLNIFQHENRVLTMIASLLATSALHTAPSQVVCVWPTALADTHPTFNTRKRGSKAIVLLATDYNRTHPSCHELCKYYEL